MKKILYCFLIFCVLMQTTGSVLAGNRYEQMNQAEPRDYALEDVNPIVDSFSYAPHVITVPPLNGGNNPVVAGDELVQVAYVDDVGRLYDAQANLTKKQLKIFLNGNVIASSVLSDADSTVFRNSGQSVEAAKFANVIIEGIIVGLVILAVTIAYNEAEETRICSRNLASSWARVAGEMRSCKLRGGNFDVTNSPTRFDCGASATTTCR